jgi:hypothetical protein
MDVSIYSLCVQTSVTPNFIHEWTQLYGEDVGNREMNLFSHHSSLECITSIMGTASARIKLSCHLILYP